MQPVLLDDDDKNSKSRFSKLRHARSFDLLGERKASVERV